MAGPPTIQIANMNLDLTATEWTFLAIITGEEEKRKCPLTDSTQYGAIILKHGKTNAVLYISQETGRYFPHPTL